MPSTSILTLFGWLSMTAVVGVNRIAEMNLSARI